MSNLCCPPPSRVDKRYGPCELSTIGSGRRLRIAGKHETLYRERVEPWGKTALTFVGMMALIVPLIGDLMLPPTTHAQAANRAVFEVASIRPCDPNGSGAAGPDPWEYNPVCARELIRMATGTRQSLYQAWRRVMHRAWQLLALPALTGGSSRTVCQWQHLWQRVVQTLFGGDVESDFTRN